MRVDSKRHESTGKVVNFMPLSVSVWHDEHGASDDAGCSSRRVLASASLGNAASSKAPETTPRQIITRARTENTDRIVFFSNLLSIAPFAAASACRVSHSLMTAASACLESRNALPRSLCADLCFVAPISK